MAIGGIPAFWLAALRLSPRFIILLNATQRLGGPLMSYLRLNQKKTKRLHGLSILLIGFQYLIIYGTLNMQKMKITKMLTIAKKVQNKVKESEGVY